ncbi:MAG: sigma-54-dependent Fis family transcriptional regulator [Flavobacteriales bacterium]|jgi:transcriptional regulator with PAS, ATPase and Fis domain|nr:sigma-54-dependent Fis family transcriptional regulator [Flavobacteriales bacterium]MBK7246357.1 sigma-54-dependent Fis family transcriptional regulator [Flavobacteriales bacterium]MBK9059867.1 sigma-54-dependent Fis family transcriptional regulator [Flavobacteriales bacterium]MBK9597396.1 sigma-54-dependent Fis family transcriptional regulator [Flavobacteriales bacterium]QQS72047.1 MAG: sigma-54-dependent Fis family transcriptional regulator [Flavobacteriales bacterium]
MNIQPIKQRFGIIGASPLLDRAIEIAAQVAPTDLSVLISGESGSGKEVMPQIVHAFSARKHGPYIAVNCGAIPEGTIDSELFGHEKGSFTGAHEARKGYFEVANGGTIFLDEVGELPLTTQVRLLRVLETGEFIRVGSSKAQKTNVRVTAATNVNILQAVQRGKFREDLYYRLNTVPIQVPALRERKEDIHLLFRWFAQEAASRYKAPPITLTDGARQLLTAYRWPGNVRQLRNLVEQMSVIEKERAIDEETLRGYLPKENTALVPSGHSESGQGGEAINERELIFKFLFDMKSDLNALKEQVRGLGNGHLRAPTSPPAAYPEKLLYSHGSDSGMSIRMPDEVDEDVDHTEVEESLSLEDKEKEMIRKALDKHRGKRKKAAHELGISERTLYRKIKEWNID